MAQRWLTFVAGALMCLVSGTPYLVGVYAPGIKERLGYTQSQINTVTTLGNFGSCVALVNGLMLDYFGPRVTGIFGAMYLFGGYFLFYLGAREAFPTIPFVMGLFLALMVLGSNAVYLASTGVNLGNFPEQHRGKVGGLLIAAGGLSGALFTQVYGLIFKPHFITFLLFLAICLGGVSLVSALFLVAIDPRTDAQEKAALLGSPRKRVSFKLPTHHDTDTDTEADSTSNVTAGGEMQMGVRQLLLTLNFWLVFTIFMIATACGLMVINNIGSMILSLGGAEGAQDNYVTVLSLFNCGSRIVVGLLSDALATTKVTRPTLLAVITALMAGAQLYMSFVGTRELLYLGVAVIGACYGGIWATVPVLVHELWGNQNWGLNCAVMGLGPPVMGYMLSVQMVARIYQQHAVFHSKNCYGTACFQLSFWISASVCMLTAALAVVLAVRTREMYAKKRRARLVVEVENESVQ